jgi:hypothetical protein
MLEILQQAPVQTAAQETAPSRPGGIKVRLTLGPALIDLEATLEEIVRVVTRLTQEFTKEAIIPATGGVTIAVAPSVTAAIGTAKAS